MSGYGISPYVPPAPCTVAGGSPPSTTATGDQSDPIDPLLLPLTAVQAWLNLDGTEIPDVVAQAVSAANQAVVDYLDWDPRSLTVIERVDGSDDYTISVERAPITAVTNLRIIFPGSQPWPMCLTNVDFDPVKPLIHNGQLFPSGNRNIEVTYTAGFAVLPATILQAVRYTIKSMIDGSGVDFNATGESYDGVSNQNWQPGGPATVPISAQTLIRRYKRKF